ncbi:MAG: VCBS repeat-containing protein [Verrucomicrobiales bacterium]|nr:VCBS repeat-containing protein [Verrucomicrobiales bacterium]
MLCRLLLVRVLLPGLIAAPLLVPLTAVQAACLPPPVGLATLYSGNGSALEPVSGLHGLMGAGVTITNAFAGQGFAFRDDPSSVMYLPESPVWSPTNNQFSIECWIQPNFAVSGDKLDTILSKREGCSTVAYQFGVYKGHQGPAKVGLLYFSIGGVGLDSTNRIPNDGQFHHVAAVFDGSQTNQNMRLYLDGVAVGAASVSVTIPVTSSAPVIGQHGGCNYFSSAVMDEISFYNRPLSLAEIQSIQAAGSSGKCIPAVTGVPVPYFTDFESGAGAGWSLRLTDGSEPMRFSRFLGRLGSDDVLLTLTGLSPGTSYTLGFDFYALDSLDGGNTSSGDVLGVWADNQLLFRESFANYNGNPPGGVQTFPRSPDEGRAAFGFVPSYVDAIYRNIELTFVPSNSVSVLRFWGLNLQELGDESWGIDNVRVRSTAAAGAPIISSTTLPTPGTTQSIALDRFTVAASRPLQPAAATNLANWSLRSAGPNSTLGDGDDVTVGLSAALVPAFNTGRSIQFTILGAVPLQPARYRFSSGAGLVDTNGVAVTPFTQDFTIVHPSPGRLETPGSDSIATASDLSMIETPAGSGFQTAIGSGIFSAAGDVDYWRFDAEVGDVVTLRLETLGAGTNPQMQLQTVSGSNLASVGGGADGVVGIDRYRFGSPGTYFVRVWSDQRPAAYRLRVDLGRSAQLEAEPNDTIAQATPLTLTFGAGLAQGRVAGTTLGAVDLFALLNLNAGNSVSVTARYPDGSTLAPQGVVLSLLAGTEPVATVAGNSLNFLLQASTNYLVRVTSTNADLRSQYVLDIAVSDSVPPQITSTSFPAQGGSAATLFDRFTLGFSEDMSPVAVTNSSVYELRSAGPDGNFNTADDAIYPIVPDAYSTGLSASYSILDGPVQPGLTRLRVSTGLSDRIGNGLASTFQLTFTITNPPGYFMETRGNDVAGKAALFLNPGNGNPSGTLGFAYNLTGSNNPEFMAAADLNGDGRPDLAVAQRAGGVMIYTNDGTGQLIASTNLTGINDAVSVVVGRFNNDTLPDLAATSYNGASVVLALGVPGGWVVGTPITGAPGAYQHVGADFNNDGFTDLAVPNFNGGSLVVLLCNGNGGFAPPVSYPVTGNVMQVAAGKLNNDAHVDLVATSTSGNVAALLGKGDGTFQPAVNYPSGAGTRAVAIGDVNGDSLLDVVSAAVGDDTVNVLLGKGDGTFLARVDYSSGVSDPYHLGLGDFDGDGRLDVLVPGYGSGNWSLLINNGAGGFEDPKVYPLGNSPIGTAIADFNADGRQDVVLSRYSSRLLSAYYGLPNLAPAEDPAGSGVRTHLARGTLSTGADQDYYQFFGQAGERVVVAIEVPGAPSNSGLRVDLYRYDDVILNTFYATSSGWGQSPPLTLAQKGTFFVRVTENHGYRGEYRIRVTRVPATIGFEVEDNNTIAGANYPSFVSTNSQLTGVMAGYLSYGDALGDHFDLGFLEAGTTINLGLQQPSSAGVRGVLSVLDGSGQVQSSSASGSTNLSYVVPVGPGGNYSARILADPLPPAQTFGGTPGSSLLFNGLNQYVRVPDAPALRPANLTLECWVNFAAPVDADVLVAKGLGNGDDNSYALWYSKPEGVLRGYISGGPTLSVPWVPEIGRWYHLAYVFDDAANLQSLYVDGQTVTAGTVNTSINYDTRPLHLGADSVGDGVNHHFAGKLDEIRVWTVARASNEIASARSLRLVGTEPGLAAYWRLDDGVGAVAADATPNSNQGALIGFPVWSPSGTAAPSSAPLAAQYLLRLNLQEAKSLQVVTTTLPSESASISNLVQSFVVGFNEELDPQINLLNRVVYTQGSRQFVVSDTALSWIDAESLAVSLGGHLARVTSADQNAFLARTFSAAATGDLWIGYNDRSAENSFSWVGSGAPGYVNWQNGQPDNNGGADGAVLAIPGGGWYDDVIRTQRRGLIEVPQLPDADGDGLASSLDPYASDRLNGFDLRASGTDGLFDTGDDLLYRLRLNTYARGTNVSFFVVDGPLQYGSYRFSVTPSIKDRFGNALAASFVRRFAVVPVSGFGIEGRTNGTLGLATPVTGSLPGAALDGSFQETYRLSKGSKAHHLVATNLNGDANIDLVVNNFDDGTLSVFLGQPDSSFINLTNVPVGSGPVGFSLADFNKDGKLDLSVDLYQAARMAILLGDGTGRFTALTNYVTPSQPYYQAVGDLNADGNLDVAVATVAGGRVTLFFGLGNGAFNPGVDITTGAGAFSVAIGDIAGDGTADDLAVANRSAQTLSVLIANGGGTYAAPVQYPVTTTAGALALYDFNSDTFLDAVVVAGGDINYFAGRGDGTFLDRKTFAVPTSDPYETALADIDGNGTMDLVLPAYGNSRLVTVLNLGDDQFGGVLNYAISGRPISAVVHDFNKDGRLDIATANHDSADIAFLYGKGTQIPTLDPATRLRSVAARGMLAEASDLDYWSFSGRLGDRLTLALESLGAAASSQLRYYLYRPDGSEVDNFVTDNLGRGEFSVGLTAAGTYSIRVERYDAYAGEYRLRVTLAPGAYQNESESNNTIATADPVAFSLADGRQTADLFGYFSSGDSGDYFRLGNLSPGTEISLTPQRPASGTVLATPAVYDASEALVALAAPGQTNLSYVIPAGQSGAHYARLIPTFLRSPNNATNALWFDGADDSVRVGAWSPGKRWTAQAWIFPTATPAGRRTIVGGLGGCQDWALTLQDGRPGLAYRPTDGASSCSASIAAATPVDLARWYHVAGVSDGTNVFLYVNGILAGTAAVDPAWNPYAGGVWIGGEVCCGNYFAGLISSVSIWNRPLSAAEIGSFLAANPVGNETGLVGYWPLDDGAGNTARDLSSVNRPGTLFNAPNWSPLSPLSRGGLGVQAEYRLNISLRDTSSPFVTTTTLPAAGSSIGTLLDRFSLSYSEDMSPATVLSTNSYELRNAGANQIFDAQDDSFYTVQNSPAYANGLTANYLIPDGPLQPGLYRLTVRTQLTDTSGTPLASNYVHQFSVTNTPGFIQESRANDSIATAVGLGAPVPGSLGLFRAGSPVAVGTNPEYSLLADLNGDAKQDLLVVNYGENTFSVFLGGGDGSFALKTNWTSTAAGPLQPVLTNFNGDAFPDFAVGNYGAGSVSIYLGNGNGSFRVLTNYATGTQVVGMAAGDFNGDGRVDLASANYGSGNVSVLLGLGGGLFQPAVQYPVGGAPYQLVTGDFNKDGRLDLVTATYNTDNLALLLGKGDGTFPAPSTIPTGNAPYAVQSGDLDADGNADLVTSGSDGVLLVFRGNGNGSFQTPLKLATGLGLNYYIAIGDLDKNGRADLVATGFNVDRVGILFQTGPLNFEPSVSYATGGRPLGINIGDINNDNRPDLAIVNYGSAQMTFLLGREKETLSPDGGDQTFALARGVIFSNADTDYWSFPAGAGDSVQVVIENPGDPAASGRCIDLYSPAGGSAIETWCADYNGRGTFSRVLPSAGIYSLRVRYNYSFAGEYRLRVSVVSAPVQVEVESNDSTGASQSLTWTESPTKRSAKVFGTIHRDDSAGDFFRLGNLSAGVLLQLSHTAPASSTLSHQWAVYKGNTLLTNAPAAAASFAYAIPPGAGDDYYVRVTALSGTSGLQATYFLGLEVFDGEGPQVVSTTLPPSGSASESLIDRFSLEVSEDLNVEIARLAQRPVVNGTHAYQRTSVSTSWRNASEEARLLGGTLVTINDVLENQWLNDTFGGGLWIGLSDELQEGSFVWQDGAATTFVNWNAGEPSNSANEDFAVLLDGGKWNDEGLAGSHFGIMEFAGSDGDGDGIPDVVDVYPSDPYNLFDLRGAGADDAFDTSDDVRYTLQAPAYTSGTSLAFAVLNGPIQPGRARLRVTTSLRDRLGNPSTAVYDQVFSIVSIPGLQAASQTNSTPSTATPLALQEGPVNFRTALARGKLFGNGDAEYWSFNGKAGDLVSIAAEVPGAPGATGLRYRVLSTTGAAIIDLYAEYAGFGQSDPVTLASNGVYRVLVTQNYGYYGEYRFRVALSTPPLQVENEANDSIATASSLALQQDGNARFGAAMGTQGKAADLDYFALGNITNGSSVFLNVRLPQGSTYVPVVALYNAAGQYQNEVVGGRAGDEIAEVRVLATGNYFALVRGGGGSLSDIRSQYQLDVQVVPTGSVSFPNLQVTDLSLPGGSPLSGQSISFGFSVTNVGQLATPVSSWVDRAVLSLNPVLGDADDIPLGFFNRVGTLNPGVGYAVNGSATLPEGVSGDYLLIAQTDAGNAVNEFIFETDNITVSGNSFRINRAPYPDLKVEDLQATGPTGQGIYTLRWRTANRGDGLAKTGFRDRLVVRNLNNGQVIVTSDIPVPAGLAVGASLQRETTVTTTNAGTYQVQVTTDALNENYEFDAAGHDSAELNTAVTQFVIAQFFEIAVGASPSEGGAVTGAGSYVSGNPLTVTAKANTNDRPYFFVNWTEAGVFQSASPSYSFTVSRPRSLVANFSLPAYSITASNNPVVAGSIEGQGTYFHGASAVLIANPNPGYRFVNWTEQGQVVGLLPRLTNTITAQRFLVANYAEANPFHVVTTATSPSGLAVISGSGTYSNGQSTTITAPARLTNSPTLFTFREFRLNGSPAGSTRSFSKTFSTLDPTNLQYIAYYDSNSLLPVVVRASGGFTNIGVGGYTTVTNPVPASSDYRISLQFDRSMNPAINPLVLVTNSSGAAQPSLTGAGYWLSTIETNDTYRTPAIGFGPGLDGLSLVKVSRAQDKTGLTMAAADVLALVVDVTPPVQPSPVLVSSNSASATFGWSSYAAPADLGGFRVYRASTPFTVLTGLTPITTLGRNARSHVFTGLSLDTPYHIAIVALDAAGNAPSTVASIPMSLPRSVPAPVALVLTAQDASSASLSWAGYSTANLLGFEGFWLFYETTPFTSVQGLTPKQTLGAGVRSAEVLGLDRSFTYYVAVVGYNSAGGHNPQVTTQTWKDPFAGRITSNLNLGSADAPVVDILQPMVITSNATLTVRAGTTIRFAAGAGITVEQGRLVASGSALDPIVFTSANDIAGLEANPGDWKGITLSAGATGSVLRHVFVQFGGGLTLSNVSPTVEAFTALRNSPAGLTLLGSASLTTTEALIAFNDIGLISTSTGVVNLRQSVVKNNPTNAFSAGAGSIIATQNWWGTSVAGEIDGSLRGTVNRSGFLLGEPLLTPAIGLSNGVTQVGSRDIRLRLACRTADSVRVSEDSAFLAIFYQAFRSPLDYQLSDGGGSKTVYAQFRSVTGQTSAPVALTLSYITAGPNLTAFSLTEGQVLTRPLTVTAGASAPLGMAGIDFLVDGQLVATQPGGAFAYRYDMRSSTNGVHRVRLAARDTSGNLATRELNVTFNLSPPPAPLITTPASDLNGSESTISVRGTAEPLIPIRLVQNSAPAATGAADAAGNWSFDNVSLVEGNNAFVATAFDTLGSAVSGIRNVVRDTGPPAAPVLDTLYYNVIEGLGLSWTFATAGERPAFFRVYWHSNSFTTTAQASRQSPILTAMNYRPSGLTPGNYYFAVVGYDSAGNASALSNLAPFNYDPVPPSFTVSYSKVSPVAVGPLRITLVSSEPLVSVPSLTLVPTGSTPVALTLSNAALNTFEATLNVTPSFASGALGLVVSGRDLSGNTFNGPPQGPSMAIDVRPPTGSIVTVPGAPVQTTNATLVTVSLTLNEPAKPGTTPTVGFTPPVGPLVNIPVTGNGSNWIGSFTAVAAMGSGYGTFTLNARDALDNIGQLITSGQTLELYNTALPKPPGQPVNFSASSLSEGRVRLSWTAVSNAESYRLYSQPGTNVFLTPTNMVAETILSNSWIDLPPSDGYHLYSVTAVRRGSEGTNSITRAVISDRTPPPTPVQVAVQLLSSGVQVSWAAGAGEVPSLFKVYRNGQAIRTVNGSGATAIVDSPPRGVMSYTVASVDALGNEAISSAANIELFVGAVQNFTALVRSGEPPQLTWNSSDNTAVGYNVYRNGIKQNGAPLTALQFTDALGVQAGSRIQYIVRAVNSTNAESAPRTVNVNDVSLGFFHNLAGDVEQPLVTDYFDNLLVIVSNRTTSAALPLGVVQVHRSILGLPSLSRSNQVHEPVPEGGVLETSVIMPAAKAPEPEGFLVRAIQDADAGGSRAIYEEAFAGGAVVRPATRMTLNATQQPLAGGLSTLSLTVFNQGFADLDLLVTRANGSDPGDLSISVQNSLGAEVSKLDYIGVPPGTIFTSDGRGYLRIPPAGSRSITIPGVLVPESLGTNSAAFVATFSKLYYRLGQENEDVSGPISGSMVSALAVTPYYGVATTDSRLYADRDPIIISGQAIDRATGQPKPNAPLRIGFSISGAKFWNNVTSDISGSFTYTYNPPQGMSGTLNIWAAHPDVVDTLNQAEVKLYRCYLSPANVDIRMSKNGTQRFFLTLINTGDEELTGFALASSAYTFVGDVKTPTSTVTARSLMETNFVLRPRSTEKINFELVATLDAPDNAVIDFNLRSSEGASATFHANLTLLQANPLLVLTDPSVGYVEASVNRGDIRSRSVTIVNRGLRPLQGVTMQLPTNVTWMSVNLPANSNGVVNLPDLPIGSSNSFTVVFAPPASTPLDAFQDKLIIRGTNSPAVFETGLFALVTSQAKGSVRFFVDNILVEPVPNATVRIRNTLIGQDFTVKTDANGFVTVNDLQEGPWAWQVTAAGHSAEVGVIEVIPDQTVLVETRLSRALVTVNFSVVPVPYTDRYEIVIEQTFETHVPAPVLVLTPPHMDFKNVGYGYEATYIMTAKNYGLIQMTDVTIRGMSDGRGGVLSPLISYLPVLRAQESVEIPMRFTFQAPNTGSVAGAGKVARTYTDRRKSLTRDIDADGNITGGVQFPPSFGDNATPSQAFADCATGGLGGLADLVGGLMAIANACATCADLRTAMAIAASAAITYSVLCSPNFSPIPVSPLPCPSGNWVVSFFINLASCACQALGCFGAGDGGSSSPGSGLGRGPQSFSQFSPGGPGCFTADTLVTLADGSTKRIDAAVVGDRVKTGPGSGDYAVVREVQTRKVVDLLVIHSESRTLETTAEHMLWLDGKGWSQAGQVRVGDWLTDTTGERVRVNRIEHQPGEFTVHTLINSGDHTFYANGLLVQDSCGAPSVVAPFSGFTLPPPRIEDARAKEVAR